jgi:hypothetical protein
MQHPTLQTQHETCSKTWQSTAKPAQHLTQRTNALPHDTNLTSAITISSATKFMKKDSRAKNFIQERQHTTRIASLRLCYPPKKPCKTLVTTTTDAALVPKLTFVLRVPRAHESQCVATANMAPYPNLELCPIRNPKTLYDAGQTPKTESHKRV